MGGKTSLTIAIVLLAAAGCLAYYLRKSFLRKQRSKLLKELRRNYDKAIQSGDAGSIRVAGKLYYTAVGRGNISENSLVKIEFAIEQAAQGTVR